MKVKALVSFSGAFSMYEGETKEYSDKAILQDLLQAGYVEEVKAEADKEEELKKEVENLKKQLEELKKAPEGRQEITKDNNEPKKDVKSSEGKRNNSK